MLIPTISTTSRPSITLIILATAVVIETGKPSIGFDDQLTPARMACAWTSAIVIPSKGKGFLCSNNTRWPVMFELAYIQQPARIYLLERNIHTIDRAVDQHAL